MTENEKTCAENMIAAMNSGNYSFSSHDDYYEPFHDSPSGYSDESAVRVEQAQDNLEIVTHTFPDQSEVSFHFRDGDLEDVDVRPGQNDAVTVPAPLLDRGSFDVVWSPLIDRINRLYARHGAPSADPVPSHPYGKATTGQPYHASWNEENIGEWDGNEHAVAATLNRIEEEIACAIGLGIHYAADTESWTEFSQAAGDALRDFLAHEAWDRICDHGHIYLPDPTLPGPGNE